MNTQPGKLMEMPNTPMMAKMGRQAGLIIGLVLLAMDITAGILGIEAQLAQDKEDSVRILIFECRQPSLEAYKLGLAAAMLLAFAHAIANALGGCICIFSREEYERSSRNRQLASGTLVLSWIILVFAFSLLVLGTTSNARTRNTCGFSYHHVLSAGGILCFFHGMVLMAYFMSASATAAEEKHFVQQHQARPV